MILMVYMFCCVTAPTWGIDPSWLIFFNGGWFNHKLSKCVNVNRPTCSRCAVPSSTLPETNSSPLKINGWKMKFLLERPIFTAFAMSNPLGLCIVKFNQLHPEGLKGFPKRENDGFQNETPDLKGLIFQVNHIKLQGFMQYSITLLRPDHPPQNQQTIGSCSQSSWVGCVGSPPNSPPSTSPPADPGFFSQDQRSKSLTSSQSFRKKVRPFFYAPWICFFWAPTCWNEHQIHQIHIFNSVSLI